jgi:glycosidase
MNSPSSFIKSEIMINKQLAQLDLRALVSSKPAFHPSPNAWEDQVFYFLMLDRFSDGNENGYRGLQGEVVTDGTTPRAELADRGNADKTTADAERWRSAGDRFVGGNLRGLISKIGYLQRLGITAIWVSPVFKQVSSAQTYHGYGVQNFLTTDPHFGTVEDLRELVHVAHQHGIYVVLDIILNHVANVFSYAPSRHWNQEGKSDSYYDGELYPVEGFHDCHGQPTLSFVRTDPHSNPDRWPDLEAAIWPVELQDPNNFSRKGYVRDWEDPPQYLEGDIADFKDVHHGTGSVDEYRPSPSLLHFCKIYQYWMAYADLDGYRIDAVKHMDPGATRYFAQAMHEFAQCIGKENFYLIGEIAGNRAFAFDTLETTGLDAALGIDDVQDKIEYLVKGYRNPSEYFGLFRNSLLLGKESHTWFRSKVLTMFDDHDQVRKEANKARFCADPASAKLVLSALALNVTTLGIPCLFYGSEQGFDGHGDSDAYLREAMFGGEFGAFRSRHVHFFDEEHLVYQALSNILAIRRRKLSLRRGRQYLRPTSAPEDGIHFGLPTMIGGQLRGIIPWSRLLVNEELLLAINTDCSQAHSTWVTVDVTLHPPGKTLRCLYSTDAEQIGQVVAAESKNGSAVLITVPAAGFVIFE